MAVKTLCGIFSAMVLLLASGARAQNEDLFEFKQVADGVYAAIAKPQFFINCNAAVIVNEDDVLVVDTHSKPSAARTLIRQIARLTPKPVRYVVDSHFHWDHMQGNQAYPSAFPSSVEIISTEATRENIAKLGIPRVQDAIKSLPGQIDDLKAKLAPERDAKKKAELQSNLQQAESYLQELKAMQVTLPTLTFDKSLVLHKKGRSMYILFLGRGHTSGDAVVYLPKEKVVATGDLLHGWMPFMGDGFPREWVTTLDELDKLDFQHVIGGHGAVGDKARLKFFRNYLADLIAAVEQEVKAGASLQDAQKRVPDRLAPTYEKGMLNFRQSIVGNIAKVYSDLRGK
jgi:glyoxylase-like metal-dependent hydrolase (beta-lactamase superfamily II)